MTPDLFVDMGLTQKRILAHTPYEQALAQLSSAVDRALALRPVVDLSGSDAQVYTEAERRREEPDGYEECCECGESFWREDMESVQINDERYCCANCMRTVANPGAR